MFVFSAPASRALTPSRRSASLFDHLFADERVPATAPARVPALDVSEDDTAYTLSFDVPGISKDRLKVSVLGRRVQLETVEAPAATVDAAPADAPVTDAPKADRVLYRERSTARYARTVALPTEVDQAGAVARVEHGVLTLRLSKKVPASATQLSIE